MPLDAEWLLRRQGMLEGQRANFDSHWEEVQRLVLPNMQGFQSERTPGDKRMEDVFDSTPITANEHFAAAQQSMLCPATERWHGLTAVDAYLEDDYEVRAWCDDAVDALFHARYAPRAQFGQAIGESLLCLGGFGNAVINIEEKRGEHLVYNAGHPREFFFAENQYGVIDTMHRRFRLTAGQAGEKFGEQSLPNAIVDAIKKSPDTHFDFLHVVMPKGELYGENAAAEAHGFDYPSCYISYEGKRLVRVAGYRTFPYAVGRYTTTAGDIYGRGPAITALPDIKMLNEMMKTTIRKAQMVVDPPILMPEEGVITAFSLHPGSLNYGLMNEDGKPMAMAFESKGNLELDLTMIQDVRHRIEAVFHVDLFRVLNEKPPNMTATEAMIRAQEKGALMAPAGQRMQGEFLGRLVWRELDILMTAGQLPPMPQSLVEAGGFSALKVEYTAPINQAQKAQKAVAINQYLASVGAIATAQANAGRTTSIMDGVDFDEVNKEMHDASGAPEKILLSPEKVKQQRDKAEQAQATQVGLNAAVESGKAAKDWSTAQANASAQPPGLGALLGQ